MINIERAYSAALWYQRLLQRNNETFVPLFFDKHRYLVCMGGGGSGKSIFAGYKILERCGTEAGHRWLVCRKVANTIRKSCFDQLVGQISKEGNEDIEERIERIYRGDMRIVFKNGSEIMFAGLDDNEKLKSIYGITGIWIEEASEISEADFNQLDIRLRGVPINYQQIIITFNPISILHWLKKRFFDCEHLPKEERDKIHTHRSTYKDNRFLPAENISVLEGFKYTDPYYYAVYCLGEWGVLGKSVFDKEKVSSRLALLNNVPADKDKGYFDYIDYGTGIKGITWRSDNIDGYITIYAPPLERRHYVIGGDTSGNGSDWFVAQVIDNKTGEQVCVLRKQYDEDLYAKQMYCLGIYYNTALIGIETNYSTYPVMELERLRYPKQYVRESFDNFTHKPKKSFGFATTEKTRPVIIAKLIAWVREDTNSLNDRTTLEEMLTFVRNENFRAEAESNAHDDCVMALAIANYIRDQQEFDDEPLSTELVSWTSDMWEDYDNAKDETKQELIRIWGNPKAR